MLCNECSCPIVHAGGPDCDNSGIPDACKPDCDGEGTPDQCQANMYDDNCNGIADPCEGLLFVDQHAMGTPIDGKTWEKAFRTLQAALPEAQSQSKQIIYVAYGTYRPGDPNASRALTFSIPSSVSVLGGFAGVNFAAVGATDAWQCKPDT